MQAKIQAVKDKVAQCIAQAEAKFGITMPAVQIRFDLKGRAAGMAGYKGNFIQQFYYLRFNIVHMQLGGQSWEHLLNDTVPHEVAHTVCQAFPQFGNAHNAGWKRVCIALGGNGKRCYSAEDAPEAIAKQRPYTYTTSTGHTVAVSPIIHRKIQTRGASYRFKGKGNVSKACAYTLSTATSVVSKVPTVTPHTAPTVRVPVVTKPVQHSIAAAGSKADMLRAYLKQAKADVGSEAEERTVAWAIATLGMSRTLARTYVKNNWSKV